MRILYVEDNAVNLSLIARIAQMNKHELVSHKEAETALLALDAGLEVDLILLDIQLAGEMDGIVFAKTIRSKGRTEPIIAITAYAMTGDKERIIEAGCNEYLPKPLPIAEFLTLLAKYDPAVSKSGAVPARAANPSPLPQNPDPPAPPAITPQAAETPTPPPSSTQTTEQPTTSDTPAHSQAATQSNPQTPNPTDAKNKDTDNTNIPVGTATGGNGTDIK
jgi:CheY-like chemotaxis protein